MKFQVIAGFRTNSDGGMDIRRYADGRYSAYWPYENVEEFFHESQLSDMLLWLSQTAESMIGQRA